MSERVGRGLCHTISAPETTRVQASLSCRRRGIWGPCKSSSQSLTAVLQVTGGSDGQDGVGRRPFTARGASEDRGLHRAHEATAKGDRSLLGTLAGLASSWERTSRTKGRQTRPGPLGNVGALVRPPAATRLILPLAVRGRTTGTTQVQAG